MAQLIRQVHLLNAAADMGGNPVGDVLIEAGKIVVIAPTLTNPPSETDIIEAEGQFLGPGLIDLYSQSGEPGHESRETYRSLVQAATAGGFTRVGILPNTQPATDSVSAVAAIHQVNQTQSNAANRQLNDTAGDHAQLMPWAATTLQTRGEQLTALAELASAGAIGFTDSLPLTNRLLLRRLLEYTQPLQKPVALWPCDLQIAGNGVAREGPDSLRLGLIGVCAMAETTALTALIELVSDLSTPVHIMRVSTARSVDLIAEAKERKLPITASVAWHHLLFDTQDLKHYNPNLRHDPPLGTPTDRKALIDGVANGVLDAIAIDHSPYTYEEKTVAFDAAPPGAIGLELALPLLWQTFVASGQWTGQQLWNALSTQPARCLGLPVPTLKVGAPAELTLFDPQVQWTASKDALRSLSHNTPWANRNIQGKVTRIWTSHL
ncbi:MAG: dihydroorotase [Cyanobacteria bacterium J06623_4]